MKGCHRGDKLRIQGLRHQRHAACRKRHLRTEQAAADSFEQDAFQQLCATKGVGPYSEKKHLNENMA